LSLRDKHIAHAVNDYEQTIPIAYLTDSAFVRKGITRVGQIHAEIMPFDASEARVFSELCDKLLLGLKSRIDETQQRIGGELWSLGVDAVYALPDARLPAPDPKNVTKRRK
jgi:hypothetical protein